MHLKRRSQALALSTLLAIAGHHADACTSLVLNATDGGRVYGRTMEFGIPLRQIRISARDVLLSQHRPGIDYAANRGCRLAPDTLIAVLRAKRSLNGRGSRAMEESMSSENIRALNDAFRKGERPELGKIMITPGVRGLVAAWPLGVVAVYDAVKNFDAFDDANDPHHEHDFGSFAHAGAKLLWKIDYFDEKLKYGSEDPADPHRTTRVMTIMLAEEY